MKQAFSRFTKGILLCLIFLPFPEASGQITTNIAVLPPYSSNIRDYADKTRITVTAIDYNNISCTLSLRIIGDNGITAFSNMDMAYPTFTLQNAIPVTLTGPDLSEYFEPERLSVRGMDPSEFQSQGLPPGNYQICATVNYDGVPMTELPSCSNYFRVSYLQPPMLISPANNSMIENTAVQQIIFTWTPSPGAPVWTKYILKIVEIADPSENPENAMLTATTPAFFEEEVSGTSFLYGPAQPLLDPGKRYAFQIIASEEETGTRFENFGRSEVYVFQYGNPEENIFSPAQVSEEIIEPATKIKDNKLWTIPNSSLSGTAQYRFPQDAARKGPLDKIPVHLECYYYILTKTNEKVFLMGNLSNYEFTQKRYMGSGMYSIYKVFPFITDTLEPNGSAFAYTTTKSDGNFTFSFWNPGLGLVAKDVTAKRTWAGIDTESGKLVGGDVVYKGTKTIETTTGDLYMFSRLIVDNDYYTSSSQELIARRGENINVGTIEVLARSYNLNIVVRPDKNYKDQYKTDHIESMVVYLLRQIRPQGVPANEGKGSQPVQEGETKFNMKVVARAVTGNNGNVVISDLVKNSFSDPTDQYYLWATALETSDINYSMDAAVPFKFPYYEDDAVYNEEYKMASPVPVKELTAKPLPPVIKGSVYRYDNQMQPVSGARVMLYNGLACTNDWVTYSNGLFKFTLNDSKEGDNWTLLVMKEGFRYKSVAIPYSLVLGKKFVREDILLEPESSVTGTIINEQGEGIRVQLRMDDGAYKTFQPVCAEFYAEPANVNLAGSALKTDQNKTSSIPVIMSANTSGLTGLTKQSNAPAVSATSKTAGSALNNLVPDICTKPTSFNLSAVPGNRKLIISPVDPKYMPDTVDVVIKDGGTKLQPVTVYTKMHRIAVNVMVKDMNIAIPKPLAGAVVTVNNGGSAVTGSAGVASFEFEGAGDSVRIRVDGPASGDYISQIKNAVIPASKNYQKVTVVLKQAGRIRGRVFAGKTDSSSVAGARVFADIPGEIKTETITDASGNYELRNIPINQKVVIRAVKSASGFVGDSVRIILNNENSSQPGMVIKEPVNFHLTVFNDMDISRLLGFPVEVTRLSQEGDAVFISGNFTDIPGNNYFKILPAETNPRFSHVEIIPSVTIKNASGVPASQPKNNKVSTNKNKLGISLFSNYAAVLSGDQTLGIEVVDMSKGTGAINGKIRFDETSFTSSLVTFDESVYLTHKPGQLNLAAFATDPSVLQFPGGFRMSDFKGEPVAFRFNSLKMEAGPTSRVNGDTISLSALLHTNISQIPKPDIMLSVGNMKFIKDNSGQVHFTDIPGKKLVIILSLGAVPWSMQVDHWQLGASTGMVFKSGYINTGMVTVPFTDIYLDQSGESTGFKGGNYKLDQLSLANIVTLNITGQKQFGFDPGKNAWKLSVSGEPGKPGAGFGGLPGMSANDRFEIENFLFVSNSNPIFNLYQGAKPVTLHQVGSFYPGFLTVINNEISIAGRIDFHVPYLNSSNNLDYKIFYYKDPQGNVAFRNEVAKFLITPPGPVTMEFFAQEGSQTLDKRGFTAKGKVYEKAGTGKIFEFDAWLYRTTDSTSLIIDRQTNQEFRFSGSAPGSPRLDNIYGRMVVQNGSWTPLYFGGDLKNTTGASGKLTFAVMGDLVANEQEISVSNLPGPFSDIGNLTYDFVNKRFTGIVDFSQTLAGGASFNASAEVLFDAQGWYFLGLGSLSLPTPSMGGEASVFIGSYKANQYVINKFITNSRVYQLFGEAPAGFPKMDQQFKGFFIEGGAHLPIPILPEFEFNLGLISAELSHEIGGDMRFGLDFAQGSTFHAGMSIFGRITAGVGTSMGLVCANCTVTGKGLISADGSYSTTGSWSATGYSEFGISGTTELGGGACDSDCDGILGVGPCIVDSESAGVTLFGRFSISDKGTDFEIGFK